MKKDALGKPKQQQGGLLSEQPRKEVAPLDPELDNYLKEKRPAIEADRDRND